MPTARVEHDLLLVGLNHLAKYQSGTKLFHSRPPKGLFDISLIFPNPLC